MGLGGATEKLQRVANMGEELYGKMNELREQVLEVRQAVQETSERVATIENKVDQQGAVIEALAAQEGIDVDRILTEVAIEEAEPAVTDAETAGGDGSADRSGDESDGSAAAGGSASGATDGSDEDAAIESAESSDEA